MASSERTMKKELDDKIDILIPMFVEEKREQIKKMKAYENGTEWGEYIQTLFLENAKALTKESVEPLIRKEIGWYLEMPECKKKEIKKEVQRREEMARLEREKIEKELQQMSSYTVGSEINHKTHGVGEIMEMEGKCITVRFRDSGEIKKIDMVYCIEKGIIEKQNG